MTSRASRSGLRDIRDTGRLVTEGCCDVTCEGVSLGSTVMLVSFYAIVEAVELFVTSE